LYGAQPASARTSRASLDGRALSLGTSLERKAPESLTLALCDFVHGDIWQGIHPLAPDEVAPVDSMSLFSLQTLIVR
jgi:hypothetical protein